jgi:hypothetical protein
MYVPASICQCQQRTTRCLTSWFGWRSDEKRKPARNFQLEDYNLGPQLQHGSLNGFYLKGGDGFVSDQIKYQQWFFPILPKYSGHSAFVIVSNT